MKFAVFATITCLLLVSAHATLAEIPQGTIRSRGHEYDPLPTVDEVEFWRFQGQWYEVFRLPKSYESCEEGCIRLDYEIDTNKSLVVKTACFSSDDQSIVSIITSIAKARNTKLTQFDYCVNGTDLCEDYEVIDLDKHYEWVLIGSNDRKGLWLLSRYIDVKPDILKAVLKKVAKLQFDTKKFVYQVNKCKKKGNVTPKQQRMSPSKQKLIEDFYMYFAGRN